MTFFFVFMVPILYGLVGEFRAFKDNYKTKAMSRYVLLKALPIFFIYIISDAIYNPYWNTSFLLQLQGLVFYSIFYASCEFLFRKRALKLKIKYGSEAYFMNNFYRDLFYALSLFLYAWINIGIR